MTLDDQMRDLAMRARKSSRQLARLSCEDRNRCLVAMADAIDREADTIREANQKDLAAGRGMGLSSAMLDRLELTPARIASMSRGLREVAALPDPTGRVLDQRVLPNGLRLRKVSCPLGVIVIIYESRPNVTVDAAGLCFKAGSSTILRGGKEALHSNQCLARIMIDAAWAALPGFPKDAIQVVPTTDRAAIPALLSQTEYVDLCMPRGGEGLIRAVAECSKVPVIKHYTGVCHVYLHRDADAAMAASIAVNAKCQRPGVCNAMETLLVDVVAANAILPEVAGQLLKKGVELRCDERALSILKNLDDADAGDGKIVAATGDDWSAEYLDLILAVKVVDGLSDAIEHINRYGSGHSDSIVTSSPEAAATFMNEVDAAAVYWNASTRFTDGGQFGMGAEIGISTDKIGARGPMGLEELTTYKWMITGEGQVRE